LKVMHGADYDLRLLDRDFGLRIRGLFDTMVAARLTGERAYGLAALLHQHLGVTIDKTHQLADWSRRPLPDSMLRYAAADTCHLLELHALLARRLEELGRSTWADEEFLRLESVGWKVEPDDPEPFRKVKAAGRLDSRALAVLSALHAWRDRTARSRDVPVFRVLPDAPLVAMAQNPPSGFEELAGVRGIPRRLTRGDVAREILDGVREALALPTPQLPEARKGRAWRQPPPASKELTALRAKRDQLAAAVGLEGSMIASRATLEAIVAGRDSGDDWTAIPELRQWQIALLAPLVG
jgi:ribonuclease D